MEFENVNVKRDGPVTIVEMNRPHRLNAIARPLIADLRQALEDLRMDDETRVLILTGAGKAFCVGADFRATREEVELDYTDPENRARRRLRQEVHAVIRLLHDGLDFPTIAMVNGDAVGGGFDIALACDLRVAAENARFRVRFTSLGVSPAAGVAWLLPRLVGFGKAAEYLLVDELISAQEAEKVGIVNKVVPSERLLDETMGLAGKIAANPPIGARLARHVLRKVEHLDFHTALDFHSLGLAVSIDTEDAMESKTAFLEKRPPVFRGR